MVSSISQKVKIGIFTIAGLLLLAVGIFLIGSKKNMFGKTFRIYGHFSNVGGLEVGNNIRFAGINVGTVEDIRIVSDTVIRVEMRMQEQVRPFLKKDVMATIGSDGLMGDKLITIVSGSPNEVRLLTDNARIITADPINYDKVIAKFTAVADNAEVITRELADMAIQIREGNGTISKLLYTDDLSKSLEGTAKNAERITGSIANISSEIKSGKGSLGSLVYTDSLSKGLENAVTTANAAMLTIQEAANGFSENMKALQGNVFFRSYFKKKEKEDEIEEPNTEIINDDMDEIALKEIIADAQKALNEKKKAKKKK